MFTFEHLSNVTLETPAVLWSLIKAELKIWGTDTKVSQRMSLIVNGLLKPSFDQNYLLNCFNYLKLSIFRTIRSPRCGLWWSECLRFVWSYRLPIFFLPQRKFCPSQNQLSLLSLLVSRQFQLHRMLLRWYLLMSERADLSQWETCNLQFRWPCVVESRGLWRWLWRFHLCSWVKTPMLMR